MLDPASPANRMIINMYRVSMFVATTYQDIDSGSADRIWNSSILQDFENLDFFYRQWKEDASISLPYQRNRPSWDERLTSLPPTFGSANDVYMGFWTTSLWNKHRASRIALHQALLARLDAANVNRTSYPKEDLKLLDAVEYRFKSPLIIQAMIHDIFASISFSLGEIPINSLNVSYQSKSVGGYFLIWALQCIHRCPFASDEQAQRAKATLARIGRECGLSHATASAQDMAYIAQSS